MVIADKCSKTMKKIHTYAVTSTAYFSPVSAEMMMSPEISRILSTKMLHNNRVTVEADKLCSDLLQLCVKEAALSFIFMNSAVKSCLL